MSRELQNRPRIAAKAVCGRFYFACRFGVVQAALAACTTLTVFPGTARAAEEPVAASREAECAAVTDEALKIAISKARAQLDALWLKSGDGYIAHYTIAGEEQNPLLPQRSQSSDASAISGFVYASAFNCMVIESDDHSKALVTFRAPAVRFNEANAGWTKPTPNGTVWAVLADKRADGWSIVPAAGDVTIFPPATALSRPDPLNLPSHTTWPVKECRAPKLWDGAKCARPKS